MPGNAATFPICFIAGKKPPAPEKKKKRKKNNVKNLIIYHGNHNEALSKKLAQNTSKSEVSHQQVF